MIARVRPTYWLRHMMGLGALVALALSLAACGDSAASTATPIAASNGSTPGSATGATTPAAATNSNLDCAGILKALTDLNNQALLMLQLNSDAQYAVFTGANATVKVDPVALRADADALAALPPSIAGAVTGPSQYAEDLRKAADLLDANIKSGKPFADGSGNGQKLVDLAKDIYATDLLNFRLASTAANCGTAVTPARRRPPMQLCRSGLRISSEACSPGGGTPLARYVM